MMRWLLGGVMSTEPLVAPKLPTQLELMVDWLVSKRTDQLLVAEAPRFETWRVAQ
jgi:hypothetical protein